MHATTTLKIHNSVIQSPFEKFTPGHKIILSNGRLSTDVLLLHLFSLQPATRALDRLNLDKS